MKIGIETGSLINHLHARGTHGQPAPEVGMGATILGWTDRTPATIVAVMPRKDGGWDIDVQQDGWKRTDKNGLSEMQTYEYTRNPEASVERYRFSPKTGRWTSMYVNPDSGRWVKGSGGLRIGERERYWDPCF